MATLTRQLHPQLKGECHIMGCYEQCILLINKNATLPWFILVPDTDLIDFLDMPPAAMHAAVLESQSVAGFVKNVLGYPRINFGAIGNLVPQMHLHVIGRSNTDACWPAPVWGNLESGPEYDTETIALWQQQLIENTGLQTL